MPKKIFITIISIIAFIIALTTISFAKNEEDNNTTTKLGNEVTSSMNKTEKNMDDLVDKTDLDKAGQSIKNGAENVGNAVQRGMDNMGKSVDNFVNGDDDIDRNNEKAENRAVAGTTRNYTAGSVQETNNTRNGMTGNAWIWIVISVVALVIVAVVWFYAAQK